MMTGKLRFGAARALFVTIPFVWLCVCTQSASAAEDTASTTQEAQPSVSGSGRSDHSAGPKTSTSVELSEVVVTGTHIRGIAPASSPLVIYDRTSIEQSGALTLDEFARRIPENFSGADTVANIASNAVYGRFSQGANDNEFNGAAFNLHGLGTTSTLTLLNGHRLAAAGATGLLTDISLIPLGAVDHIEVLGDGASAIYGADAVAGVVNIVTRRHFEGAQTDVSYGRATDGGSGEWLASQLLGTSWTRGNVLLDYEYDKHDGLDASQRDYIPPQGGPYSLIPRDRRNSVFITGTEDLGGGFTLTGDAIYSSRLYDSAQTTISDVVAEHGLSDGHARETGATLSLGHSLPGAWHVEATANYSGVDQAQTADTSDAFGPVVIQSIAGIRTTTRILGLDLLADGPVVNIPGGAVRGAVGAGERGEAFDNSESTTRAGSTTLLGTPRLHRQVTSVYAELFVPLIGAADAAAFAQRLELSLAGRFDRYSDFGSTANPKYGLLWSPLHGLDVRATYGTSFRAPPLSQVGGIVYSDAVDLPDPISPSGFSDTLLVEGGNATLRPEKASSYAIGFDARPQQLGNLSFSATYFQTVFRDRIASPLSIGAPDFSDPVLAPFISRSPSLSAVQAYFGSPGFQGDFARLGPEGVQVIFDDQQANIAASRESGLSLSIRDHVSTGLGGLDASLDCTHLLKNEFRPVYSAPYFSLLDTFAEPTAWKAHGSIGWSARRFESSLGINYVNGYRNTLFNPARAIGSWTTADLFLGYRLIERGPDARGSLTVALSVHNVTDTRPPYVSISPAILLPGQQAVPYDPVNASPIGRLISIRLTQKW